VYKREQNKHALKYVKLVPFCLFIYLFIYLLDFFHTQNHGTCTKCVKTWRW